MGGWEAGTYGFFWGEENLLFGGEFDQKTLVDRRELTKLGFPLHSGDVGVAENDDLFLFLW